MRPRTHLKNPFGGLVIIGRESKHFTSDCSACLKSDTVTHLRLVLRHEPRWFVQSLSLCIRCRRDVQAALHAIHGRSLGPAVVAA